MKLFQTVIVSAIFFFAFVCFCQSNEGGIPAASISVSDTVVCQDVVDREPIGAGEIFPNDIQTLYCFTRVTGAPDDTEIIHNWYFNKQLVSSVNLSVRSTNWRTFSSKSISTEQTGNWRVEILTEEGNLLKQIYFLSPLRSSLKEFL